jgi:hypothetical protein
LIAKAKFGVSLCYGGGHSCELIPPIHSGNRDHRAPACPTPPRMSSLRRRSCIGSPCPKPFTVRRC